jgi:hypothetical protein
MKPADLGRPGDRVRDKRDGARGVLVECKLHRGGSPKWLVQWEAERLRSWAWQSDLCRIEEPAP